jgi:hypothetical protein
MTIRGDAEITEHALRTAVAQVLSLTNFFSSPFFLFFTTVPRMKAINGFPLLRG